MIDLNYIEVNLATLRGSEAGYIDANSGKVAWAIFSPIKLRSCELTDAKGYVHTLADNCEFNFVVKSNPENTVSESVIQDFGIDHSVPAIKPVKKSLKSHFNKAVDGETYKAIILNQYGKPTEVSVKFLGDVVIVWPYISASFLQGDLIINVYR